ncbi:uncharacterized protein LOC127857118 isoform X1 [Dreissena polymorpha]|uniref:uncharacterized protein LOC127857118 isoform X1 n=2 Tax=Dreissena polymorpha TaxID=45954 RepID=UPI002264B20D|nr:uncharacterized protein LOC127857118 isoform X1 [Dreissena polymorpha]
MDTNSHLDITIRSVMMSHQGIVNVMFPKPESKPDPSGVQEPKRFVKTMDFDVENTDYTVAEFYERFVNELPQVVMISQGFLGDIVADTFDREMIIRIQTVSRQRRVVARADMGDHSKLISIPLTYPEKVCVVKKNKLSKVQTIKGVLDGYSLPCHVQFPKDITISVGGQTISTNHIPKLQLQKAFDEMYLLGNFIVDGVMGPEVVHVPLYLSQLRMTRVTCLKNTSQQKWRGYLEELARFSSYLNYDKEYGNEGIAQYDASAVHSDTVYSYVEPRQYSNIASVFQYRRGNPIDIPTSIPSDEAQHGDTESGLYHEITDYHKPILATFGIRNAHDISLQSHKALEVQPQKHFNVSQVHNQNKDPVSSVTAQSLVQARENIKSTGPEPRASQQPNNSPAPVPTVRAQPPIGIKPRRPPPEIPKTHESPHLPESLPRTPLQTLASAEHKLAIYSNDLPRTSIPPFRQEPKDAIERKQICPSNPGQQSHTLDLTEKSGRVNEHLPTVNDSIDVKKLSINEVCGYLKVLRLEKYESMFREDMIDGALLAELSKDNFEQAFGMTVLEAVRVLKFAKEGHLPR